MCDPVKQQAALVAPSGAGEQGGRGSPAGAKGETSGLGPGPSSQVARQARAMQQREHHVQSRHRRWQGRLIALILLFLAAAAAWQAVVHKWGLHEAETRVALDQMLDGTAHRPFVYRQAVPWLVNTIDAHVAEVIKTRVLELGTVAASYYRGRPPANDAPAAYHFRRELIFYLGFLALFSAALMVGVIAVRSGRSPVASVAGACLLTLSWPFLATGSAYFYDPLELAFFAAGLILARTRHSWLIVPLAVLATWNKESFIFFLPTLYPLLREQRSAWSATALTAAAALAGGVVYLLVRDAFAANPGGAAENHLWENIAYYINPLNSIGVDRNYGIPLPRPSFLLLLGLALLAVPTFRRMGDSAMKQHIRIAAAINLPLFITLGFHDEIRALSMLFIGSAVVLATWIDATIEAGEGARSRGSAVEAR